MSTETPNPQPGDTVRIVLDGAYVREGDPTDHDGGFAGHLVRVEGVLQYVPLSATVEVLERADDPSKDDLGTLRLARSDDGTFAMYVHGGGSESGGSAWVVIYTSEPGILGERFDHGFVAAFPVIGAVPGTPAAEAQKPLSVTLTLPSPQVRVENTPSLPIPVRQQAADRLVAGDVPGAVAAVVSGGFTRDQAEQYVRDMEEWQTYLNHHGGKRSEPRTFSSDGPEPPQGVSVVEWLEPRDPSQYRYLHRQDDGGWLWSTSPTAYVPEIPAASNTWAGATDTCRGEYREVC